MDFSTKYDAANLRIELYMDDTLNSNPYDVLSSRYEYNAGGYLIAFTQWEQGSHSKLNIINLNSVNKINWITHEDKNLNERDTTYFNYQTVSGGTDITTITRSYYQTFTVMTDTFTHSYANDFRLLKVQQSKSALNFEYNVNNSLKKITSLASNYSVTIDFSYASGLMNANEDLVEKIFLGRDHYIQNIKRMYVLAAFIDAPYFTLSGTDRFHPTRMFDTINDNGQVSTETRT